MNIFNMAIKLIFNPTSNHKKVKQKITKETFSADTTKKIYSSWENFPLFKMKDSSRKVEVNGINLLLQGLVPLCGTYKKMHCLCIIMWVHMRKRIRMNYGSWMPCSHICIHKKREVFMRIFFFSPSFMLHSLCFLFAV